MARGNSPTVRRRRLASELRRLREASQLTIDEVGEKLECSASKISRIETGHVGVTPRDVRDMLELYAIDEDSQPPEFWAILDEAVLHRTVGGPAIMRAQLLRLLEVSDLPHVTLQVVPFGAGAHAGMENPFLILGFPEPADPDVVYVENTTTGSYLEEPSDVYRYTLMFDHLRAAALNPADTLLMVKQAADRLT